MKSPKLKKSFFSIPGAALLAVVSLSVFSCADDFNEGTSASISIVLPGMSSSTSEIGRSILTILQEANTEDLKNKAVSYKVTVTGEDGFSANEEITVNTENPEPKALVISDIPFGKCTVNVQAVSNLEVYSESGQAAFKDYTIASGTSTVTLSTASTVNVPVKLYVFAPSNIVDIDVNWGSVKTSYTTVEIKDGSINADIETVKVTAIMKDGSRILLDEEDKESGICEINYNNNEKIVCVVVHSGDALKTDLSAELDIEVENSPITTWDALSQAITDASNGDTITIAGNLEATSQILVTKSLTIKAKAGTTIKPAMNDCLFQCNDYSINFVIKGESSNAADFVIDNPDSKEAAFFYFEHSNLTFKNATIQKLSGDGTSAIKVSDETAELTLENVTFKDNAGGYPVYTTKITATNCRFTNNKNAGSMGTGGAIFCNEGTLTDCEFTGNSAELGGGAIHKAGEGTLTINRGKISGNYLTQDKRGAGIFVDGGKVILDSVEFGSNYIFTDGTPQSDSIPDYDIYTFYGSNFSLKGKTSLDSLIIDAENQTNNTQIDFGVSELDGTSFQIVTAAGGQGKLNFGITGAGSDIENLPVFQKPAASDLSYIQSPESAETREAWIGSSAVTTINTDGTVSFITPPETYSDWTSLAAAVETATGDATFYISGNMTASESLTLSSENSIKIIAQGETKITSALTSAALFAVNYGEFTLEGEEGNNIVIDGNSVENSYALLHSISSGNITLKNVDFINANGTATSTDASVIYISNASSGELVNVNLKDCKGKLASIISSSNTTFTNCNFENCSNIGASSDGGAVKLDNAGTFTNCTFTGNNCMGDGGAVCIAGSGTEEKEVMFTNCTFKYNYSDGKSGGAAAVERAYTNTIFRDCAFEGNYLNGSDTLQGAAIFLFSGSLTVDSVKFNNNYRLKDGQEDSCEIYAYTNTTRKPVLNLKGSISNLSSLILALSGTANYNVMINLGNSHIEGKTDQEFRISKDGADSKVKIGVSSSTTSVPSDGAKIFETFTETQVSSFFELPSSEEMKVWTKNTHTFSLDSAKGILTLTN